MVMYVAIPSLLKGETHCNLQWCSSLNVKAPHTSQVCCLLETITAQYLTSQTPEAAANCWGEQQTNYKALLKGHPEYSWEHRRPEHTRRVYNSLTSAEPWCFPKIVSKNLYRIVNSMAECWKLQKAHRRPSSNASPNGFKIPIYPLPDRSLHEPHKRF